MSDFNFVSGKVRRAGAFVSGQVDSMGAFVSGAVESVGRATFPVFVPPAVYPLAAFGDYYFPATALLLANNDPVSSWIDVIAAEELAQSDPTARPVYLADVAGYPAVKFDGTNDHLWTAGANIAKAADTTANASRQFAVYAIISATRAGSIYDLGWGSSSSLVPFIAMFAQSLAQTRNDANLLSQTASYASTGRAAILITQSGTSLKFWANGLLRSTVTATAAPQSVDRFALGALLRTSAAFFSPIGCHAVGVARGAKAVDLHTDASAFFAAATAEWGTP